MVTIERRTQEIEGILPDAIPYADLMHEDRPAILKGVLKDVPLVRKGLESPAAAIDYLLSFYNGKPVTVARQSAELQGRYFYDETATRLNFKAQRENLGTVLGELLEHLGEPDSPGYYIGSTDVGTYLPGLREDNGLLLNDPMFEAHPPVVSIWIGNRTTATAHYDMSNNIACTMVGHRRFTLFPPEQVANLYPGPLEPTPGGQVVSMVDFRNPDYGKFPGFRDAVAAAEVAEMEPGDILFYPSMWWHHVEALDDFNAMVNYWWNTSPAFMDTPQNTLLHALLSMRDRPEHEKRGWKALFDYYIFGPADQAGAHLPEEARGNLGPMDDMKARRLRALLLQKLNR